MSSILSKPNFYKDLAFLSATPEEYILQDKLITNIPTMYELKLIRERMFLSDPLLYKGWRANSHTKCIDSPNYPCGMKWRGGEAGNAPEWKIRRARENANELLHDEGYLAPLYYMERCNVCNEFVNRFDMNKYYDDEDTRAYCK